VCHFLPSSLFLTQTEAFSSRGPRTCGFSFTEKILRVPRLSLFSPVSGKQRGEAVLSVP